MWGTSACRVSAAADTGLKVPTDLEVPIDGRLRRATLSLREDRPGGAHSEATPGVRPNVAMLRLGSLTWLRETQPQRPLISSRAAMSAHPSIRMRCQKPPRHYAAVMKVSHTLSGLPTRACKPGGQRQTKQTGKRRRDQDQDSSLSRHPLPDVAG